MVRSATRARCLALILACLAGMLASPAGAVEAPAPEALPGAARYARALDVARSEAASSAERQIALARVKVAIVVAALGLAAFQLLSQGSASPGRRRLVRVGWGILGALAVASFFRFSLTERSQHDLHAKDAYHYFMGAKYFPELGYGTLYDCSIAVAAADGYWWLPHIELARDLTTMRMRALPELARRGARECPERLGADRWAEFQADARWFFARVRGPVWERVWRDHGYNPSPVWSVLAAPIARFARADQLPWLVQLDSLLVAVALASIGWAFGFEVLCLAAVAWGTGWLWRYNWIGDAFLRQIWFASAVVGVCALRRRAPAAAGALLGVSALVRVFPAIFAAGYGINAAFRTFAVRAVPRDVGRFAAGFAGVVVLLVAASGVVGRGLADYRDFARNTEMIQEVISPNEAGLKSLLWRFDGTTDLNWPGEPVAPWLRVSPRVADGIWLVASLIALGLFARAARLAEPWEAAALGFALIPILTGPSGYYFHFSILAALLSARRPGLGVALLLACLAWLVNGMLWRDLGEQFTVASVVALALSAAVLVAMNRRIASADRAHDG